MILVRLLTDIENILGRITKSHLERYAYLQSNLMSTGIHNNQPYQRTFNGFYKMQRRKPDWYRYYFALLEREKTNSSATFGQILNEIYRDNQRVEPSFSSKLVATIRPEMPVYDRHVRENLSLKVPAQHRPASERLIGYIGAYEVLERHQAELIHDEIFTTKLKPAFDRKFSEHACFTDAKKLDLLLWQFRPAQEKTSAPAS